MSNKPLQPGDRVGNYILSEVIGEGKCHCFVSSALVGNQNDTPHRAGAPMRAKVQTGAVTSVSEVTLS